MNNTETKPDIAVRTVALGPEIPEGEMMALERSMGITNDIVTKVFKSFAFADPRLNRICYRNTKDSMSYGYFISPFLHKLCALIIRLGATSVLDLGCGACIALEIVRQHISANYARPVKFGGIEIEDELIKLAHAMFPRTFAITHADLLKLERQHIERYDILYMWEPFFNYDAAGVFVNRLAGLLHVNQTIIMKPSGSIIEHLAKHEGMTELKINDPGLAVFYLKA